jgi:hypothetical protein
MSVHVLRTIELDALQIFKAVVDCGVTRAAARAASRAFKHHDAVKTAGGRVGHQGEDSIRSDSRLWSTQIASIARLGI